MFVHPGKVRPVRRGCVQHAVRSEHRLAVERQAVVRTRIHLAVLDGRFDRTAVGTADSGTERNDLVAGHQPAFFRLERAVLRVVPHPGHAVTALDRRTADPVLRALVAVGVEQARPERQGLRLTDTRILGGARHAVRVHRRPETIGVLGQVVVIQVGHPVAGIPGAEVLAVDRLVVLDPVRRHSDTQRESGTFVHCAVHRPEYLVERLRRFGLHLAVGHQRTRRGQQVGGHILHEVAVIVREHVRLHESLQALLLRRRGHFAQPEHRHEDAVPGPAVGTARA